MLRPATEHVESEARACRLGTMNTSIQKLRGHDPKIYKRQSIQAAYQSGPGIVYTSQLRTVFSNAQRQPRPSDVQEE